MICRCGHELTAEHRHRTHWYDSAGAVLELYTCPSCRTTRAKRLNSSVTGCQCAGCDEANSYAQDQPRCGRCDVTVERGHCYCAPCRDELATRAARRAATIGSEFAAMRRIHERRSA